MSEDTVVLLLPTCARCVAISGHNAARDCFGLRASAFRNDKEKESSLAGKTALAGLLALVEGRGRDKLRHCASSGSQ
jgi:hypothetical protein